MGPTDPGATAPDLPPGTPPDLAARGPWAVAGAGARLIASFVRGQPLVYGLAAAGAIAFTAGIVAASVVVGRVTDDLLVPVLTDGEPVGSRLRDAVLLVMGVAVWKAAGIVLRRSAAGWLQSGAQRDLQRRVVARLFDLPMSWYGRRGTGDLLSVADNDARRATDVLAPLPFATGVVFLLGMSVALLTVTDPWLGLAGLLLLATVVAVDLRGSWRMFAAMQVEQALRGRVGEVAHESFDGAVTVKALGREAEETDRFADAVDDLARQYVRVGETWSFYRAVTEGLPAVGTVLVLLLGVVRLDAGTITTGELVRVTYLLSLLAVPVRLIGYLLWDAASSVTGWERVREVLDLPDHLHHGETHLEAGDAPAGVATAGVSFSYDGAVPVLRDVALDVRPGQVLAVVGPTGSGKSTLLRLLARLWDPTEGAVRLDGRDLRDLGPGELPEHVAYVTQDVFLFDDTVRDNITLRAEVPDEDVEAAARLAAAHEFIRDLPRRYDTTVGERGTSLSGGQRQRVALARALVRRPRLLLLDDATSAVDPSVETRILQGLRDAALPSTVVVVAYRRSSILLADRVAYVEDGRVVATGTHEALLRDVPGYARLLRAYDDDAARREEGAA
ncbi:MAG: ABC transporter ATP-binding protein [Actinomycetes bacterium]